MTTVYVAGNGNSRKDIDLHLVKSKGKLYGCNLIYTDIAPDVLVATDPPMAKLIQQSGYALQHEFHTRTPLPNKGALELTKPAWGWSSGPNAVQLAVLDGADEIFLFGFDFGSVTNKFNNIYAGTELYKKSTDVATYGGNWHNQIETIIKHNNHVEFTIVIGDTTRCTNILAGLPNVDIMNLAEFTIHINNVNV